MTIAGMKTEINLNTVVVLIGFLGTFAGIITLWNGMQYKQQDFDKWIAAHDIVHKRIDEDITTLHKTDSTMLDLAFRVGQLEKGSQLLDDRIGRVTENYGNQFTDIRSSLGAIATQLALTNQSLQRLEAQKMPMMGK